MKKATRFLVSLMLLLLIIASIIWYLFIYDRAFTRDTLLSQARYQAISGNSRLSSWFYDQFMTNYAVGDVVDAKIVKLMTFGAFAEILPGVDGLIHISQIADRRIGKPEDVLSEGQDVKVKITDVDAENKRISLSIRALLEDNGEDAE